MVDYGFYGEAHYDNEPSDYHDRGAYDRVLNAIYRRGKADGAKWKSGVLKCPYMRSDFAEIWSLGVFNATENAPLGDYDISEDIPL